jgi:hypothetical protein
LIDFNSLRDYATGRLGLTVDQFWKMTPSEFEGAIQGRNNAEKQRRVELAATAFAIAANINRDKISIRNIYHLVVGEPMDGGSKDEELEESIYQESKLDAIKIREAEIRKLIDRVMTCQVQ